MFIYLGNDVVAKNSDIIGVFDIDNTTVSKDTRNMLSNAEKNGRVVTITYDLPRSFVITSKKKRKKKASDDVHTVYLSQISSYTLKKRTFQNKENKKRGY